MQFMKQIKGLVDTLYLRNLLKSSTWYLLEKSKDSIQVVFTNHNLCTVNYGEIKNYHWEYHSSNNNLFIYLGKETFICRPFVVGAGAMILHFIGRNDVVFFITESKCKEKEITSFQDADSAYGELLRKYEVIDTFIANEISITNQLETLDSLVLNRNKKLMAKMLEDNTEYRRLQKAMLFKMKTNRPLLFLAIGCTFVGLFFTTYLFFTGGIILYIILCLFASFIPIGLLQIKSFMENNRIKNECLDAMRLIETDIWKKINS